MPLRPAPPSRSLRHRVATAILFASAVLVLLGLPAPAASAAPGGVPSVASAPLAPAPLDPANPFTASTNGMLLDLDLVELSSAAGPVLGPLLDTILNTLGLPLGESIVDFGLSHTEANADSNGGAAGRPADRSQGLASNLYPLSALAGSIDLTGLLTTVEATAPAPEYVADTLVSLPPTSPIAPLLTLGVSEGAAAANWVSDTECVAADEPVSAASLDTATATILGLFPGGGLANTGDGITSTQSVVDLPATGGPNDQRAVRAASETQLAGLNFLGGALRIGVETPARLVAQATGQPGGATYQYTPPSLLNLNNGDIIGPDELEALVEGLLQPAFALLDPLNALGIDVAVDMQNATSGQGSADGTSVEAAFDAFSLRVLVLGVPLIDLHLLPLYAQATAPAGGLFCGGPVDDGNPIEATKASSGPAVQGSTFDYTISVGNVGDCALESVQVVDVLTGPPGTEVVSTEPAGQVTSTADGFRISWPDVGTIPPDGRKMFRIRVKVPDNAPIGSVYVDDVTATGTCDGRTVTDTAHLEDPVVEPPGTGPCNVSGSEKAATNIEVYPSETFGYLLHLYNSGGEPCTGVTVSDTLDDRLTFVGCSDGCTHDGQDVSWVVGTLAPGQSITLQLLVRVKPDATGRLQNAAVVDTDQTPPVTIREDGPLITDRSVPAPNQPARTPGAGVPSGLPRTGAAVPASLAGVLALAGVGLARVRRASSA